MILANADWWLNLVLTWNQALFSFVQTAALIITAVFAIIYTRETVRMRKEAQSQAKSAYKQLEIARLTFATLEEDKERSSYPYFVFRAPKGNPQPRGGKTAVYGNTFWHLNVTNKGAAVYWIRVKVTSGNVNYSGREVFDYLDKGESFDFDFGPPTDEQFPVEWLFEVSYINLLNREKVAHYRAKNFRVDFLDIPDTRAAA